MELKTTWDFTPLYKNDNDPKIAHDLKIAEQKSYEFINNWKGRTDYLENPKILRLALDEYEILTRDFGISGNYSYYLGLRQALDQTNPDLKAKENKLYETSVRIYNDLQFFEIAISKMPKDKQSIFLESPLLKDYKHMLERSFAEGSYILSDAEEKIINIMSKTSLSNWISLVSELLSKEELDVFDDEGVESRLPFNTVLSLVTHKDKRIRQKAAEEIERVFEKHLDVIEVEMNTVLENARDSDALRGYTRPDESRHISDDIDSSTVDALISRVSNAFSISKEFYAFKAKLIGQLSLAYFEKAVEYGDLSRKYSYEDAVSLVAKVFSSLDKEFYDIFSGFVSGGFIDVYPKKGKIGGAFCANSGLKEPTYILLNHTDKLTDVLTIAHETGHGINNELIRKKQLNINFDTPTSTAEVASTFMEDFVFEELLAEATDEEKLILRVQKLDSDIATIFRQVAFYNFELELHKTFREKGYLSKGEIGELFYKHMESYLGSAAFGSENWWTYVGHFRRFFYVYSYASGLLISKALQAKVRLEPTFISHVKEFLSTGLSDSPKNIFAKMGIDISDEKFWQQGINEVEQYLSETICLAKKLGKIS